MSKIDDDDEPEAIVCHKCQRDIVNGSEISIVQGLYFHSPECLRCDKCTETLGSDVYGNKGIYYCMKDYFQDGIGPRCDLCLKAIRSTDFIRQDDGQQRIFHTTCMRCSQCDCFLPPNDTVHFIRVRDDIGAERRYVFCSVDYDLWLRSEKCKKNGLHCSLAQEQTVIMNNVKNESMSAKKESMIVNPTVIIAKQSLAQQSTAAVSSVQTNTVVSSKKLSRTLLNKEQFELLSETFKINSKPDQAVRISLSGRTGLSEKVIKIWFQNRRAKQRRSAAVNTTAFPAYKPPDIGRFSNNI